MAGNVTTVGRWVAQRLPTRPTQHSSLVHFFHVDPVINEMKSMHGEGVCKFIGAVAFMEWCDGHQLVEKIQSITPIKIKAETMIMWTKQVLEGLSYLHLFGLIHQNINPGNIYLDSRGNAKIGGYMSCKVSRSPGCKLSYGRSDRGSHMCTAPEVQNGLEVTHKADVWDFGCCLFFWVTGEYHRDGYMDQNTRPSRAPIQDQSNRGR